MLNNDFSQLFSYIFGDTVGHIVMVPDTALLLLLLEVITFELVLELLDTASSVNK